MSEFIQIEIGLKSAYGAGGFRGRFPRLAALLKNAGYDRVLEEEPDLYHMVDVLVRVRNDPSIPQSSKAPVLRSAETFIKARDEAREQLLARRLNELDRTLYRLEDLFRDLERELA